MIGEIHTVRIFCYVCLSENNYVDLILRSYDVRFISGLE